MGLDMYLNVDVYMSEYTDVDKRDIICDVLGIKPDDCGIGSVDVSVEVGYWRKANAIHKWFVDNCQDGVDDCRKTYVAADALVMLCDACKSVLSNHSLADELLPSESGFFFGSTDYDEYYYADLEYTVNLIETILDKYGDKYTFSYQSLW
jgi:hypothetical protein